MNTRVENINKYVERKANEEYIKKMERENEIILLKERIKLLAPRMKELLEVGIACQENGIELVGQSFGCKENYGTHQFISNGWSHLAGFVTNFNIYSQKVSREWACSQTDKWKHTIGGFGQIGGGACNYNLVIYFEDNELIIDCCGDELYVLKDFLGDFDDFEREFYNYVDNTTKEVK